MLVFLGVFRLLGLLYSRRWSTAFSWRCAILGCSSLRGRGPAGRAALRRSIELSKFSRGRIFVLWLLLRRIAVGLALITQIFFIVIAQAPYAFGHGSARAQQFVAFLTNSFVAPILATGTVLFYYDQRVRKEGYDIEWMMQAAGLTPPPPSRADRPSDPPAPVHQPPTGAITRSAAADPHSPEPESAHE